MEKNLYVPIGTFLPLEELKFSTLFYITALSFPFSSYPLNPRDFSFLELLFRL